MKHRTKIALGFPAGLFVASLALTAGPAAQAGPPPAAAGTPDPAVALYEQTCGECHDSVRIVSKRRTKAEWQDVINKMIEEGATASGKQFETIFAYLLRNYGKVYVNTAPADQLTAILSVTQKDADAIVAFRTANGAFADFNAVRGVPGVDVAVLDAHKDAVQF